MQDITADSPAVLIKSQFPNLTNAQINECKARFKELDADNDGATRAFCRRGRSASETGFSLSFAFIVSEQY